MVDDISVAARWAVAQGIADPAHMCIVGLSFGGYAALMSACASRSSIAVPSVSQASDPGALVQDSRFGGRIAGEYLVGDDRKELDAGSPPRREPIEVPVPLVRHRRHPGRHRSQPQDGAGAVRNSP
jgi:hypothetical protein